MKTEHIIFMEHLNVDTEKIYPADLNDDELALIKHHIEITRYIQEIDSLFHVFRFNLKNILHYYNLMCSDKIVRQIEYNFETSDNIAINALTISFISAGKTLIESIEGFLKMNDTDLYQEFRINYLSKEYDDNFHFRFLLRLRDYAQHGHLPVSMSSNDTYCFDLNHLLSTPHFSHNSTIKNQMENIKNDIYERFSDYPYIALTRSLAEFNICCIRIYLNFLKYIRNLLHNSVDNIESLLNQRPEIVYKSKDCFNNHVFYEVIDDILHMFNINDNPKKMLSQIKNIVSDILKEEQIEIDKIRMQKAK